MAQKDGQAKGCYSKLQCSSFKVLFNQNPIYNSKGKFLDPLCLKVARCNPYHRNRNK